MSALGRSLAFGLASAAAFALAACTPGGSAAVEEPAGGRVATSEVAVSCGSPERFCLTVVRGPGRPLAGWVAVDDLVSSLDGGSGLDLTEVDIEGASGVSDALMRATAGDTDLVVVLPGQGTEAFVLELVVSAAIADPSARLVTVAPIDGEGRLLGVDPSSPALAALETDNLAVIGVDIAAWADAAAAAALESADGAPDPAGQTIGLVAGSEFDPGAAAFADRFEGTLGDVGAATLVERHPGALDGTASDAGWDRAAVLRLVDDGATVIVGDVDGMGAIGGPDAPPCVVLGSRPSPAPGCAVAIVDPGVDTALAAVLDRRRSGTGPSGLVRAVPETIGVAAGG